MIETKLVETPVHGRYLVRRGGAAGTLIGFHGYAETADAHLSELERISGIEEWTVVAIQALHPFYVRSTGGVVASWMTSLDREEAIADNLGYVRRVVSDVAPAAKRVFAGFSQGAAMAYRAAAALGSAGLFVIGGDVPPDISVTALPPVLIGRGKTDDWYTAKKFEEDLRFLAAARQVETVIYEGGHEWTEEIRNAVGQFLERLARV